MSHVDGADEIRVHDCRKNHGSHDWLGHWGGGYRRRLLAGKECDCCRDKDFSP
jgi:hypothetical protein